MGTWEWDYILKYVLLGDSGTGKSSLLIRLTDDRFVQSGQEPTLGVEFGSRILEVKGGKRVKVQCWDTAGTESFRSITRSYFRGAAGALLVYDVTRRETFEHVSTWLQDLRAYAEEDVSIILIANKVDLCSATPPLDPESPSVPAEHEQQAESPASAPPAPDSPGPALLPRQVSSAEGRAFAQANGLLYLETSAKEGWGVVQAFERTAAQVLERTREKERVKGAKAKAKGTKADLRRAYATATDTGGGCC